MKQPATRKTRQQAAEIERRILAPRLVLVMTGLSRTTLWRMCQRGEFPRPARISPGRVGFFSEDIEQWLASKREA